MDLIFQKISSYNLFNYLFSGVIFSILVSQTTSFNFVQTDPVLAVFLYYFIGLIISRIGSLIIEPILRKTSFVKFAKLSDFITASGKDPKIETLSESNNVYRTFISVFVCILLIKLYDLFAIQTVNSYLLIVLLLIIFLFSYKKQTRYIVKRINKSKSHE